MLKRANVFEPSVRSGGGRFIAQGTTMSRMTGTSWRARADEELLVGVPRRGRIAWEIALLLLLVFGENLAVVSEALAFVAVAVALVMAFALIRPWSSAHGGIPARAGAILVVIVAVVLPTAVAREPSGFTRRLGIGIATGAPAPGDPPLAGGIVDVEEVAPKTPAEGVLHAGDRIVGLGGAPLDAKDPTADLTRRTHSDELPEDTTVTVVRGGAAIDLPVHVPKVRAWRRTLGRRFTAFREIVEAHVVVASAVRGALLIALLLLLVRADGQPLSALGIARKGALSELFASTWMTLGTFGVQVAVAIPVGIIGVLTGVIDREASQRTQTLGMIADQGSVAEFVLGVIVAAAFEEVAFRGFFTPRLRALIGSWPWSVVIISLLFGLGHTYEGALAVVQTAFLGAYFSACFLVRRRLLGPWLAHAAFNTGMFLVIRFLARPEVLEKLKQLAPH
ncbi:MAG TPA: CPBP family glutamic-type intramembrane protease [Polyangiaceae bacterium]